MKRKTCYYYRRIRIKRKFNRQASLIKHCVYSRVIVCWFVFCCLDFFLIFRGEGVFLFVFFYCVCGFYFLFSFADDFITAENNCERNANCRIELLLQYNNQLELCFWPDQKTCFLLTCMCTKDNITEDSSGGFKCTDLKKVMLQEVEQINTTDERSRVENDHERNCITAIDNCNNTREKENSDNIYTTISELILQNKGSLVLLCSYDFFVHYYINRHIEIIGDREQKRLHS